MDVIAALAGAPGAFDAKHVELALDVAEHEIGAGRWRDAPRRAASQGDRAGAAGRVRVETSRGEPLVRRCVLKWKTSSKPVEWKAKNENENGDKCKFVTGFGADGIGAILLLEPVLEPE